MNEQEIIDKILLGIIIGAPILGIVLFLWMISKPLPPYAGKSGNEYVPPGKERNGPVDGED